MAVIKRINFRLLRSFSSLMMQQITTYIITIVTFGVISRLLSPTEMGVYGLLVSTVYLIGLSSNFGMKKVAIRLIAGKMASSEREGAAGIYWKTILLSLPSTILLALGTAYLYEKLGIFKEVNASNGFTLFTILLILFSFRNTTSSGLEALHLFHYETLYYSVGYTLYRFLMIYFLLSGYGVEGIIIAWILGELVTTIYVLRKVINQLPVMMEGESSLTIIKKASPLFITDLILSAAEYGDRIASTVLGLDIVAFFYIASVGVMFLTSIYQAIQSSILPHLSEEFHINGFSSIGESLMDISRYVFIFISPIFLLAAALAEPFIIILAGPQYLAAAPIFQIMCIGLWLGPLNPILQSTFIAVDRNNELMTTILLATILDIFIMIILYPKIGYLSTGLGRAFLVVSTNLILLVIGIKLLNIKIDYIAYVKSAISGLVSAGSSLLLWTYIHRIDMLPLYIIVPAVIYLLMIRLLKFIKPEEVASLYLSLPKHKYMSKMIKAICILTGIDINTVLNIVSKHS